MLKTIGVSLLASFCLLLVLFFVAGFTSHDRGGKMQAAFQAHEAVRRALYNPDAADFKETVTRPTGSPNTYNVSGILYSTNGYGGTVPATYEVVVDFSGEGHDAEFGRVTHLKVNNTVYR